MPEESYIPAQTAIIEPGLQLSSDLAQEMLSLLIGDTDAENEGLPSPIFDALSSPVMTAAACMV